MDEQTRSGEMRSDEREDKVIRVESLEDFDRELARDGGETLEVRAWIAAEYGIFPEDVGTDDDIRDDGHEPATEPTPERPERSD